MNIQQLKIVRETARRQFNLTAVAAALYTSQSGVSKHLRDLEDELGVVLFERHGKRLLGLTEPGQAVLRSVERILAEMDTLKQTAQEFIQSDNGTLRIATTHTQARYALPKVLLTFQQRFPKVRLELHQCSPSEIVSLLRGGEVDIGIATEALMSSNGSFICFPYYSWNHSLIVPEQHPLTAITSPTLEEIAAYPLITYHEGYTGRQNIDTAFQQAQLQPEITMTAIDADVIKTYVELGLGVGIIASMAFDERRDQGLSLISGKNLFQESTTFLAVRRSGFMRSYLYDFINLCNESLTRREIDDALAGESIV
ncbi:CysB family HTH-type transcriptional regulator [Nitrincola alkalilacustris]|uniref:CysB family HTH-type transcriptional regulator n=1 Tax=Nitrincola alkalilacustris TaxID=1571224 RepID=UPI00124E7BF1|nr:CysB family HTH-type transcriptional regulator [Nitrincola alkalilacustris]